MLQEASLDREARQKRALQRNWFVATTLLLAMAFTFLITGMIPDPNFWTALIHAAAEAGVVGGLADWFAVTAVFRHPLGLPFPHTAIVPRGKDRIGEGLGTFLERHFLTDELMLAKVRAIDPATRLAIWITAPGNADRVAGQVTKFLPHVVRTLDDEEIRGFTATTLGEQLREVDLAPILGRLVGLLTAGGYHAAIIDRVIDFAVDFIDRNSERLELAVAAGEQRRWWIPKAADQQIAHVLLDGFRDLLNDLREPDHAARKRMLRAFDTLARDLATSPDQRASVEEAKKRLLEHPDCQAWMTSVWDDVRDAALDDLGKPSSKSRQAIATALASTGRHLLQDEHMRGRLNTAFETAALAALPWRTELARFIAEVVRRWDERALVERMELLVGADLQYVRFTGTIVGASIGCMLFLISMTLK
jgi:uncharacterized membrane-anchored protein YjiN (DUF445 family)